VAGEIELNGNECTNSPLKPGVGCLSSTDSEELSKDDNSDHRWTAGSYEYAASSSSSVRGTASECDEPLPPSSSGNVDGSKVLTRLERRADSRSLVFEYADEKDYSNLPEDESDAVSSDDAKSDDDSDAEPTEEEMKQILEEEETYADFLLQVFPHLRQ
jgi:hypothetical protein